MPLGYFIPYTVLHPISVTFVSDPVSPIGRIGGSVHLICTASLSPVVDIPVTVQISVTNPAQNPLMSQHTMTSNSSYTSQALIRSFGNDQAGIYTCNVTLSSPMFLGSISIETLRIYTGKLAICG